MGVNTSQNANAKPRMPSKGKVWRGKDNGETCMKRKDNGRRAQNVTVVENKWK